MLAETKKKLIIVLGMHRSGTSAITRSLPILGVNLGDALYPAAIDNPKGFWENRECLAINEELLLHFDSKYDYLGIIKERSTEDSFVNDLKYRAVHYVSHQLKEHNGLWGFKDPRTCRLLFFWQEVTRAIQCDVGFVIVLRNPLSIAASLAKRNQIAEGKSHLLWLQHILPAVLDTVGSERIVIDYDTFMDAPFEQLVRISSAFGLQLPDREGTLYKDFQNSFLEENLRHTKFTTDDLTRSQAPRDVVVAYQLLCRLARDEADCDDPNILATVNELFARFQANSQFFCYSNRLEETLLERNGQISRLNECLIGFENSTATLQAQVQELSTGNAWLSSQRDAWEKLASELETQISQLRAHAQELSTGNAWLSSQRDAWEKLASELKAQISQLQAQVQELSTGNAWLSSQCGAWEKLAPELKAQISQLQAQAQELSTGNTWITSQRDVWQSLASDRKGQIAHLNKAIAVFEENDQRLKDSRVFERLKDAEATIEEIFTSKSWRLTKPLRALRRRLDKKKIQQFENIASEDTALLDVASQEQNPDAERGGSDFDVEFYRKAYPDTCGFEPYYHYSNYGKNEGRLPYAPDPIGLGGLKYLDESKESILIVSHEASRTGAPILALNIAQQFKEKKYNVIVFLLRGGGLLADFQKYCDIVVEPFPGSDNPFIVSIVLKKVLSRLELKFAIVNSIVSKFVLPALASQFVPTLCLIHEFAAYTYPKNAIRDVVLWASQVIFSARIVFENNAIYCDELKDCHPIILPQGKCRVPFSKDNSKSDENERERIRKLFRSEFLPDNTVIILGAGSVQFRKGVDLFLACAARVVALCPQNAFRFVWVGQGFDPNFDLVYSVYLQDQIKRARLGNYFCFAGEMSNIDMAYELSDILFLSSRLDPLPNVAVDAMFKQLPVICFDGTTGIADLFKENGLEGSCVIPYVDVEQAAQRLVVLIDDAEQRDRLGKAVKEVGKKLFDMKTYADSLERLALDCVTVQEIEKSDCALIEETGTLNLDYCPSSVWPDLNVGEIVRGFVRAWKSGIDLRKPFPGFHPGIYEDCHGLTQPGRNPLADFIQAGKPEGPWLCDLIQPSPSSEQREKEQSVRAALHIHVFCAELILDILQRLEDQNLSLDLLISVQSSEVAEEVSTLASSYKHGVIDIKIVSNRSNDIGPLLTEFSETISKNYEVIGHVYAKEPDDEIDSTKKKPSMNFLLENLIGKTYPMASTILEKMTDNEKLGLVFPDYPWIEGWSGTKRITENFAEQLGLEKLPERYFDFPIGNMFWARTEALKPLLAKGFKWEDCPDESLHSDGTFLNVIERLLPLVAQKTGYQISMIHIPGITR